MDEARSSGNSRPSRASRPPHRLFPPFKEAFRQCGARTSGIRIRISAGASEASNAGTSVAEAKRSHREIPPFFYNPSIQISLLSFSYRLLLVSNAVKSDEPSMQEHLSALAHRHYEVVAILLYSLSVVLPVDTNWRSVSRLLVRVEIF